MRLIRTSEESGAIAVEVEGRLDAVTAYDLRTTLEDLVKQGRCHISLDLTRVQNADDDGVDVLLWCSEHAIRPGRVLTWKGCSRPLAQAIRVSQARRAGGHRHDGVERFDERALDSSRRDLGTPHAVLVGVDPLMSGLRTHTPLQGPTAALCRPPRSMIRLRPPDRRWLQAWYK